MAIKIDAETMRSNAATLRNLRGTHDENITAIGNLIRNMCNTDVFTGDTANAYLNRYDSMQATFQSFSELLEEFATNLENVASNFTDIDTSLASALNK